MEEEKFLSLEEAIDLYEKSPKSEESLRTNNLTEVLLGEYQIEKMKKRQQEKNGGLTQ